MSLAPLGTAPTLERPTRLEWITLAAIIVAFGFWLLVWATVIPMFQAPDETAHLDAAVHLALGQPWSPPGSMHVLNAVQAAATQYESLPKPQWSTFTELLAAAPGDSATVNQMTQHPPTAYLAYAVALRAAHYGDLRFDHAILVLRLVDALTIVPLPFLAWATVRRLTRSPRAALIGALALFAVPQLASIGTSVSNDAPVMLFAGIVVWISTRVLTGDLRRRTLVWLGLSLGTLIWIKGTGLPAIPFVALAVLVGGARELTPSRRILRTLVTLTIAAAVGSWWWFHNLVTTGRLQPDGYASTRPPQAFPPGERPSVGHFINVSWGTLTRTFWGSPGIKANVSIGDVLTAVLTIIALLVIIGFAFRRSPSRPAVIVLATFPALLIGIQTVTSAHAYLMTTQVAATQGRYYFPAIIALIALSAVAWRRLAQSLPSPQAVSLTLVVLLPTIGLYGLAVVSSWFWNAALSPFTAAGIQRYTAVGPIPEAGMVLLGVLAGASLITAVAMTFRVVRAGRVTPT